METSAHKLSERELEILQLVATGASNKEIASQLYISANTVKVHLRNIFDKIGVQSRTEAAMFAVNAGIIPGPSQVAQSGEIESTVDNLETDISTKFPSVGYKPKPRQGLLIAVGIFILIIGLSMVWWFTRKTPGVPTSQAAVSWESWAPMPVERYGFASIVYENQIYVLGGQNNQGVTGELVRYDPIENRWRSLAEIPVAVADVQAAVIGGKIYVPGGRLASGEATDVLEIYDPDQDRWTRGEPLPEKLSAYALVEFEGKLYLFGGWDGKEYLSTVLIYDPDMNSWSSGTELSFPRAYASAVVVSGKVFLLGGLGDKGKVLDLMEVYTPSLENSPQTPWSDQITMPEGLYGMGAASVLDVIYIVGGRGASDYPVPVQVYSTYTGEWQVMQPPISGVWSDMGSVILGNELYVIGGKVDDLPGADTFSLQVVYVSVLPFIR
ncbi:MAG: kelch repeat-containing protein [Chloroflexota bacterium]